MDFLAGFIDVNNIGVLNDASEKINVSFRQGPKYVESVNYIKHHDFYPIYCATSGSINPISKSIFGYR